MQNSICINQLKLPSNLVKLLIFKKMSDKGKSLVKSNIDLNEVKTILSAETLNEMSMSKLFGGQEDDSEDREKCNKCEKCDKCDQCSSACSPGNIGYNNVPYIPLS